MTSSRRRLLPLAPIILLAAILLPPAAGAGAADVPPQPVAASDASQADAPQTADLLLEAPYRQAYVAMQRLPDWVRRGQATSTPATPVTLDGQPYMLGHLCKPHDCGNNQLDILFAAKGNAAWGSAAWGLLNIRPDDQHPFLQSWLGTPDRKIQALLLQAHAAENP